jgi:hypothetical protein
MLIPLIFISGLPLLEVTLAKHKNKNKNKIKIKIKI